MGERVRIVSRERLLLGGERRRRLRGPGPVKNDLQAAFSRSSASRRRGCPASSTRFPGTRSDALRPGRRRGGSFHGGAGRRRSSRLDRVARFDGPRQRGAKCRPTRSGFRGDRASGTRPGSLPVRANARAQCRRSSWRRACPVMPARASSKEYASQRTASGPTGTACSPTRSMARASLGRCMGRARSASKASRDGSTSTPGRRARSRTCSSSADGRGRGRLGAP